MEKSDWRNMLELVGFAAIALSLIFVGLQLRQDHLLARSELGAGTMEAIVELNAMGNDTEFAATLAKMINDPNNLTDGEMIQIDRYLHSAKALIVRECYLVAINVFDECDTTARVILGRDFGSRYAQAWWKLDWSPIPYIPDWANDELTGMDDDRNVKNLKELRDSL